MSKSEKHETLFCTPVFLLAAYSIGDKGTGEAKISSEGQPGERFCSAHHVGRVL